MSNNWQERTLAHGDLFSVRTELSPLDLQVLDGTIWVTIEGKREDLTPAAGTLLVLPAGALVVVQALSDACVQIRASREIAA